MLQVAVYLLVTLSLVAGFLLLVRVLHRDRMVVTRRISQEFGRPQAEAIETALYKDTESMTLEVDSSDVGLAVLDELRRTRQPRSTPWQYVNRMLSEAKVEISVGQFLGVSIILGVACFLSLAFLAGWLSAAVIGLTVSLVPYFSVLLKRKTLREKLVGQLPAAFELMARALRSGHSMPQAIQGVIEAFEGPLGREFAHCQQQQHFGLRAETVFREMAKRSGIVELRIFVMAMIIQRQIGGNLSEVLDRLAVMIRARIRLHQQIRTLTAEACLQGWTLAVLPLVMLAAMFMVNRQYVQVLLDHKLLLAGTAASMLFGILWIRCIVRIED